MLKLPKSGLWPMLALFMGLFECPIALASYPVPPENMGKGTIQFVNYATRTVTVAGHVYKIAPKASYVGGGGIKTMSGLQSGMKIRFIANGPVAAPASRILNIVVLPPKPN